jgi:hypothetical protein
MPMPRTNTEWVMLYLMIIGIGFFLISIATGKVIFLLQAVASLLLLGGIGWYSYYEIPAYPPSVGVLTFLGVRMRTVVKEGWVFAFPGIEEFIIINYLPFENVYRHGHVRCLLKPRISGQVESTVSGGVVAVYVSLMFVPDVSDPYRLHLFINNGGSDNIARILQGVVQESLRQAASLLTWEQLSFGKGRMTADLIFRVTGRMMPSDLTEEEARIFLNQALLNGAADVHDLGVKIRRLNVTKVDAEGLTKKNAQRAAAKLSQREAVSIDMDTLWQLSQKVKKEFPDISDELALEIVRVSQGHATENIVRSSGNPFLDAVAFFKNQGRSRK